MFFIVCVVKFVFICSHVIHGSHIPEIDRDKLGSDTYDTVCIKDSNSVAVSSGFGRNRCINIIDIVSNEVLKTISMDTDIVGMAIRGGTIVYRYVTWIL
jgi:hypothetical protein